jgi:hypothetical protein
MSKVEEAKQVLEAEREATIAALTDWEKRWSQFVRKRFAEEMVLEGEKRDLLLRGKAAGVPVVEMAEVLYMTRQKVHHDLREAEHERDADSPSLAEYRRRMLRGEE